MFHKNSCLASKRVLDPRCYVNLSADKNTMDQRRSSAVFDSFNSVPLSPLDGLPPAPPICKSLHHLFVNLLHQKIYLSVNLKKYVTLDEMVLHDSL